MMRDRLLQLIVSTLFRPQLTGQAEPPSPGRGRIPTKFGETGTVSCWWALLPPAKFQEDSPMWKPGLTRNLCLTLAVLARATVSAEAQISDDVVKIGVITDMNGPLSTATGRGSV